MMRVIGHDEVARTARCNHNEGGQMTEQSQIRMNVRLDGEYVQR
jgi:hypothetical protein